MKTKFTIAPRLAHTGPAPAAGTPPVGQQAVDLLTALPQTIYRRFEKKLAAGFLYFREDENTIWDYWFQSCAAD